jgi:hypothetical protein
MSGSLRFNFNLNPLASDDGAGLNDCFDDFTFGSTPVFPGFDDQT